MAEEKKAGAGTPLGKPGGLYDSVKLTRRGANTLAAVSLGLLVLVFVLVIAFGRSGIPVDFDPNGGTDVPGLKLTYGDTLPEVADPTREGYVFTGWYRDPACSDSWDMAEPVTDSLTLYAGWEPAV